MGRPFTLGEGLAAGLTPSALSRPPWIRVGSRLYCLDRGGLNAWAVLAAHGQLLPADAMFAGPTAAWMHALDLEPIQPVEVIVPPGNKLRSRFGLKVRHCRVAAHEINEIRGMRVTALHRTLRDLCLRLPSVEALVALDMAVMSGKTNAEALGRYSILARGSPGARRMRCLIDVTAPAESPMETRLRWLLLKSGLPMPEVQVDLHDWNGRFLGRADLYYPQARLVIEFDGGIHRDKLVADDQRQNAIVGAGYVVLRFTAVDVFQRAEVVATQVRHALESP